MARLNRGPAEGGVSPHTSLNRNADQKLAIPDITPDLLHYLDIIFPDRIDSAWVDMGDVREAIGSRKVVDHLRRLYQDQEQNNVPGG